MLTLSDNLLTSLLVKFVYKDSLFTFKTTLVGDIRYVQIWDLDYQGRGKAEKVTEFLQIWKGDAFTLLKPLILITPPKIDGIFDKREFADFLNGEVEKRRFYLKRLANKLEKEMKAYLESNSTAGCILKIDNDLVWVKIPRKWVWLANLLSGEDKNPESDAEK